QGVFCYAPGTRAAEGPEHEVLETFGRIGTVVQLPESQIDVATAVMGCGPAFFALVVESLVDAAVRNGMAPDVAGRLAVETMAGTATVLRAQGDDTAG